MSILNRTNDGVPSVLLTLWKCIRSNKKTYTQKELEDLCAPASLGGNTPHQHVRNVINRWKQIGLFIDQEAKDEPTIELADSFNKISVDEDEKTNFETFRSACLQFVLEPSNSKGVSGQQSGPSADFCFAASWVLSLDPFTCPCGPFESNANNPKSGLMQVETDHIKEIPYAFQNNTRWNGFRDWASFLGLGFGKEDNFQIDPSEAIRMRLPNVFGSENELSQNDFLTRLAQELPVLDRGDLRTKSERRFSGAWRALKDSEVSPSLTRALLRLEREEEISIEQRGDGDRKTLLGRGYEPLSKGMSHVIRSGK